MPARIHAVRQSGAATGWFEGPCHSVRVSLHGRVVIAIWTGTYSGNEVYTDVYGAPPGRPQKGYIEQVIGDAALPSGEYVTGVASASGLLFYSVLTETATNGCVGAGGPCVERIKSSAVKEASGRRPRRVAGLPPAYDLAGGDDHLAIVVAAPELVRDRVVTTGDVDVYAVPKYRRVASAHVDEPILGVAVSHSALAVLTRGAIRIGATTIAVPQDVNRISLSGRHVAYASDRSVYVDGRVVARRKVQPIGVSITGRRVVWAERSRGRSVIYSLG